MKQGQCGFGESVSRPPGDPPLGIWETGDQGQAVLVRTQQGPGVDWDGGEADSPDLDPPGLTL